MRRRVAGWLFVTSGLLLTGVAILPLARWTGAEDAGPPWPDYLASWFVGAFVVLLGGAAAGRYLVGWKPSGPRIDSRVVVALLAVGTVAAAVGVVSYSFAGNPHLVDEMAQLFQARVYAAGMLAAPAPQLPSFFLLPNTFITDAGWISQYPPGGSALLAVGTLIGLPWMTNPLLGGCGVFLTYRLARSLYDQHTGILAAVLWATSAWVLSMSATYMNHAGAVTFALVAWSLTLGRSAIGGRSMLAAGMALALCASVRPLDGLIAAVPLFLWWIKTDNRTRSAALIAVGSLPVLALWGWINWRTLGSPVAMGYLENFGSEVGLGFHVDPFGNSFSLSDGVANLSSAIRRLNIYLFEWPIPATLPLLLWLVLGRLRTHSDVVVLGGVMAAPLIYMFYFHSGFYPGPRFLYVCAPFLVIGTARSLVWMYGAIPAGGVFGWKTAFVGCAVVTFVWGMLALTPGRLTSYRENLSNLKIHPLADLAELGVTRALVLVPESWGARVMARMWGGGVPAGLSERAYRRLDLCELDSAITAAEEPGGGTMEAAVQDLLRQTRAVVPPVVDAPDPTLRLRSLQGLRSDCVRELRRDLAGFTPFAIVGWLNDPKQDGDIVFARDMFERNGALLDLFGDRPLWRLAPPSGFPDSLPRLEQVTNAGN